MSRWPVSQLRKTFPILVPLALFAGCAGNGEGLDANGRPDNGGPPAPSNQFQEIQDTIFTPICTNCHLGASAPVGLRLDAGNSFTMLVNVPSVQVPSLMRVNPGNPNASYLVQKIEGTAQGARMPLGGPFLSQTQIDLVRAWIAAGAPMNVAPPDRLLVASSVPAPAEQAAPGLAKITVIFNSDVDNSLVSANSFELRDAAGNLVPFASASVPLQRQNVVELVVARPLPAGRFELSVRGSGPAPLASVSGHVLDGDADGTPGGDKTISFDVNAGESR